MTSRNTGLIPLLLITLIVLASIVPATAVIEHVEFPRLDEILYQYSPTEDTRVNGLLDSVFDMIPGPYRIDSYNLVQSEGYNQTIDPGFYEGVMVINCRDYFPPEASMGPSGHLAGEPVKPLNDTDFRIALQYIWGMDDKADAIYEYYGAMWKEAEETIVPPAQEPWHNPSATMPNTGFAMAWAILQNAGYYVNITDQRLYNPDGTPVRDITVSYAVGTTNWEAIAGNFVISLNSFMVYIGALNGPTFILSPSDCETLIIRLLFFHDFDIVCIHWFMASPYPDWLYDMFHSSNIGVWGWNLAGIADPEFDTLLETIKYSLNPAEVLDACNQFQLRFNYEVFPCFPVYSGYIINTFHPDLTNFLPVPGYGSDNDWTWKLMHWTGIPEGGTVRRALSNEPIFLNPYYENTLQGWQIMGNVLDSVPPTTYLSCHQEGTGMALCLLHVDPTNITHHMPWIVYNWNVTYGSWPQLGIEDGMKVTFYLRNDVTWHDGTPFTSYDAAYAWTMIMKYQAQRYPELAQHLAYVEPECPYIVSAYLDETSLWLPYHLAATANLFPKHIWTIADEMIENGTWTSLMDFDPDQWTYQAFTGNPPPLSYPFMKALIGTGPYVLDYYNPSIGVARLVEYDEYWVNSSVVGCVDAPRRVDPNADTDYRILVQNVGAKSSGQITNAIVDVEIYLDGLLENTFASVDIDPFDEIWLGSLNTGALAYGLHNITIRIYEAGTLIHTYTHEIYATILEDINLDFCVNILDVSKAAHAFGSDGIVSSLRWNPKADVTNDFKIRLDDILTIALMYGWGECELPSHQGPVHLLVDMHPCEGTYEDKNKTVVGQDRNFTAYIKIMNVANLYSYDIRLDYNATLSELVDWHVTPPGWTTVYAIQNYIAITAVGPMIPFTGDATIAELTFTGKTRENVTLDPLRSVLGNDHGERIPYIPGVAEIMVSFVGDVNKDGKTRVDDILAVALAFGTNCGGPPNEKGYYYEPDLDVTNDVKIRVDDILATALNFGAGP